MVTSGSGSGESSEGRRTSEGRLNGLRVLVGVCFGGLALSFWLLQVIQNSKFDEMAANNHLRTIPLRAPRGVIFDRSGKVLVENRYSYTIALLREQTTHLDESIRTIAAVTGVDEARIRDAVQRRRREPVFRPLPLIEHATFAQVAAVTARRLELPEIVIQQVPTRAYPEDGLAAHLFGYVGEVQDAQLNSPEFAQLLPGAIIGQTGLERTYNAHLMGTDGNKFVVVNSVGREIEELKNQKQEPVDGERLQLTIDYDLQRALEDGFRAAGFSGAAAFLDPSTGEVLAMTSLPAYDPNDFAGGMDNTTWTRLTTDPEKPMTNRLIQGTYSPGSTFKILMAVAALEEGVITPETKFFCPGYGTFYGRPFKCWKAGGHGLVDVRHAIEQSCNVFFYNVGDRMKIDTIHAYAEKLGLTGRTGIDLPGEIDSLVPSTEWKQRTQHQPWYPGETISVAIGQGAVSVTPIAMATMIASVAHGGTRVTPHLAKTYDAGDGKGWQPLNAPAPRGTFFIKPDNLQAVRDGLWLVVNGAGTGGAARIAGYDVSGKTGTSQVVGLQNKSLAAKVMDVRDNGWFVFFAPRDNPQIAGAVFAEHGLHGSSAAPIAKHVMETFFAKKEGRPLPSFTARARPATNNHGYGRTTDGHTGADGRTGTAGASGPIRGRCRLMVDRRLLPHLDLPLVAALLSLTLIGIATIYSVTWDLRLDRPGSEFWTQVYALPVALIAMLACLFVDYRSLAQRSLLIYVGLVAALLFVAFFGTVSGGARRWIRLGGLSLQPSEFARLTVALVLAMYYGTGRRSARTLRELAAGGLFVGVPFLFIARQPDLGTAATLIPVYLGVAYLAGLRLKWIGTAALVLVLLSPAIWAFGMQDYQKGRITTFVNPGKDPRGAGYQQIQAMITVGSGGFYGKGFRQGTQGGYGFLPVAHNDFVFSVLAEEHGFLGVLVSLGLYLFVILRSLEAAKLARDRVGAYLVVAIISGFGFQVVYNITMSAGLAPVKGLTLPLMSYGGSSLVATLAGFGLILNVRMRRFSN